MWDGRNHSLYETPDISNYQPRRTAARRKRTCAADMYIPQDVQLNEKSAPKDRKDIARALHERNLLRLTESIQFSPNGRFCFIKFSTK